MRENSSIHLSITLLDSIANNNLNIDKRPDIKAHIDSCDSCSSYIREAKERKKSSPNQNPILEKPGINLAETSKIKTNSRSFWKRLKNIFHAASFSRPILLLSIVILITCGIIFYQSPFLKGALSTQGLSSFKIWINSRGIEKSTTPIPCHKGDTLQFSIISEKSFNYYVLYQDDGGSIKIYLPENMEKANPAGNRQGELLPNKIILNDIWKKKTMYCILTDKRLSFVEAITIINRFLRKELPQNRPLIETFYLLNLG